MTVHWLLVTLFSWCEPFLCILSVFEELYNAIGFVECTIDDYDGDLNIWWCWMGGASHLSPCSQVLVLVATWHWSLSSMLLKLKHGILHDCTNTLFN